MLELDLVPSPAAKTTWEHRASSLGGKQMTPGQFIS